MSGDSADPIRLTAGNPRLPVVLDVWRRTYGPPEPPLAERLADGRSVLFALFDGTAPAAFVHFRDHKAMLREGPLGGDETARLLAESPEFAAYSFAQLYFAGGRWDVRAGCRPLFEAMAAHLRATTVGWALIGHLHSDRAFFAETAALLETLGWRRRPGDYVTWRLELPVVDDSPEPAAGPCAWRFLDDPDPPPIDDLAHVCAAVFPDDPPEAVVHRDLAAGRWGPWSGAAYDGGRPVAVVLVRAGEGGVLNVERLGTVPELRGRGVVAGAFAAWARRCRAAGFTALEFQVRSTNAPATRLVAERLGARRVKEERFYVLVGEGSGGAR